MTREEATGFLIGMAYKLGSMAVEYSTEEKDAEKMREAIEVLEQEKPETVTEFADRCRECGAKYGKLLKQEPCEDAISRAYIEPIIEELENIYVNGDEYILNLLADIKNAPPVTPQPKIGQWIDTDDYYQRWKCSECGCHTRDVEPPFCPNCGVKMKSEG